MTRRLQVLFLLALLGVLVVLGLVAHALAGAVGAAAYAVAVVVLLGLAARRGRSVVAPARAPGTTCACCTTTVHDPVEVL